jgi:hypothetical protein
MVRESIVQLQLEFTKEKSNIQGIKSLKRYRLELGYQINEIQEGLERKITKWLANKKHFKLPNLCFRTSTTQNLSALFF